MLTHFNYHPPILQTILQKIAETLVQPGKILIDASEFEEPNIKYLSIKQDNDLSVFSLHPRKSVKEILFSTPLLSSYVSGVIINEASVSDLTLDGWSLVNLFRQQRLVPGIKLNKKIIKLSTPVNSWVTEGLDDLGARCKQYKSEGFHFAQWSMLLEVSYVMPPLQAIHENANDLARFVSVCQAYQMVPITNIDVVQIGDHDILHSQKVTEMILMTVFKTFNDHHIFLQGLILKINFITQGILCENELSFEDIACSTITALRRTVPISIGGIVFTVNYNWRENTMIYTNDIIKDIKGKRNNLYTITLSTNRLNDYLIEQSTSDEEHIRDIQNVQNELLNDMFDLSNTSVGRFHIQSFKSSYEVSL